jgi:hypothetical protein
MLYFQRDTRSHWISNCAAVKVHDTSVLAALTGDDLKRAYAEAHSLKGAVGVFETPQVFGSVSEVARHAKNSDLAAAKDAFAVAQPLVERLLAELAPIVSAAQASSSS